MLRAATLALVITILAAGARTALAQEARLRRIDAPTRAAVQALLDSARAASLPTEPLVDRALEGASKGAPGDRIVAAARRLLGDLRLAREVLGPEASAPEIEAGAAALRAGVGRVVVARLQGLRPERLLTVPLAVLADLVAHGVPPDTAATAVLALAQYAADDDYLAFRRMVERDIALGMPPMAATAAAAEAAFLDLSSGDRGVRTAAPPRKP